MPGKDNLLTIGYIGNGKSTNRYHLPFATLYPSLINVKTIFDRSIDKITWPRYSGIHYTNAINEILTDKEIELIVIATPVTCHYELAKMVISHGKNCIIEKPFTLTYSQAEELFDYAERKGVMLQAYQNRRFDSDYLTVKKVINSGVLGEIYELRTAFDYYRPEIPNNITCFSKEKSMLYDLAPHSIDQMIALFGTPDKVHYDIRQLLGNNRMNDYYDIDLYYDNLKATVMASYYRLISRPSFEIYGKKGLFIKKTKDRQEYHLKQYYMPNNQDFGIDRPEDYGTLSYIDENGIIIEEKIPTECGNYGMYYIQLYKTIKNNEKPEVTRNNTLLLMRILEEGLNTIK